jgi:hypothetical protein
MDNVKPLKYENSVDGSQNDDYPTEVSPTEDYITAKGFSFENLKTHYLKIIENEISITDTISGTRKLSEFLIPQTHKILDQLVHDIAENSYTEIIKTNGKVSNMILWTNSNKLEKIREINISRVSGKVNEIVTKQYNSGSLVETYTETFTRTGTSVTSIQGVLT